MKKEKVFEILGEGGGICISRQKSETEEIFIYRHSEFDPTDEGLDINEKSIYLNFEKPFQRAQSLCKTFLNCDELLTLQLFNVEEKRRSI